MKMEEFMKKTIYLNGLIETVCDGRQQAMVILDKNIMYVGTNKEAMTYADSFTEIVDLQGKMVLPGFNDSHMHLIGYGTLLSQLRLQEHTSSIQEVIRYCKEYIKNHAYKEGQWICGRGWNHDFFKDEKRFLTKHDLDCITTTRPLYLTRACGHVAVCNSKALEVAGLEKQLLTVEGGSVDLEKGLFFDNALSLLYNAVPQPSVEDLMDMILKACQALNKDGITSCQTDDFTNYNVPYEMFIEAYQRLYEKGLLTVKVNEQSQLWNMELLKDFISKGYKTGMGHEYFKIGPLKLLGDGSLGARTAYLTEPYCDDQSTSGLACYSQKQLDEMIQYAHNHGMQIAVHCIGDGIMTSVMNSYKKVLGQYSVNNQRHGIVHCQITNETLLNDFENLNLIAYIQPIFLDYDLHIVQDRVGSKRANSSYQFKRLYKQHACGGSDCPVEFPNVLKSIQCAMTRCDLNGVGPYLEDQALSFDECLRLYTIEGAYASFEENIKGTIEKGKRADFVIFEHDLREVDIMKLKDEEVYMTILDGVVVYQKNQL